MAITDAAGTVSSLVTSINRSAGYKGLRIYHAAQYGDAFTVTFTDPSGVGHSETIAAQQPVSPLVEGYSDEYPLSWSPYRLSAKYFADVDKKTLGSDRPQLILRLTDGGREAARTSLIRGDKSMLGKYRVELDSVEKWVKLVVVDITGIPAVFTGFAIIMLGGLLHFMTPPRDLIALQQPNGSYKVFWKTSVFKEFYDDERVGIAEKLQSRVL